MKSSSSKLKKPVIVGELMRIHIRILDRWIQDFGIDGFEDYEVFVEKFCKAIGFVLTQILWWVTC